MIPIPVGGDTMLNGTHISEVRHVLLPDGRTATLRIDGAWIEDVDIEHAAAPRATDQHRASVPGPDPSQGRVLDAAGWRYLPAAGEPHAHLDKALTAHRMRPGSGNDLEAAITQWRDELAPAIDGADIAERAREALRRYVSRGITSVRTHVNTPTSDDPLVGVRALAELRDEVAGAVDLQLCLLPSADTPTSVIDDAAALGIDLVGGCPHLAPDPAAETTRLLDAAQRHGLAVDLHTDEQTDASAVDLEDLAEQVIARDLTDVTASHCVRLGSLPPERLARVLDAVARAGIGLVTLPITNLYLQGRDATHLRPRGIAPLQEILDAGIPLAAGADNLRDPFNPVGRADPFETTSLLVTAGHLTPDEALAAVTTGVRTVMGLPAVGARPGAAADFLLVPATDLGEVIAGAVDDRVVIRGGTVVATSRTSRAVELAPLVTPSLTAATTR